MERSLSLKGKKEKQGKKGAVTLLYFVYMLKKR